jgi:hypothetical protein
MLEAEQCMITADCKNQIKIHVHVNGIRVDIRLLQNRFARNNLNIYDVYYLLLPLDRYIRRGTIYSCKTLPSVLRQ